MVQIIIACSMVVILCIVSSNVLYKLGVPTLLIFLALGMLCGSDAIGGIYFDNYEIAKNVCSVGLVFIMFFGGFGTSWKTAKPVIAPSILMSTVGTLITAGLVGVFCSLVFGIGWIEGMLIGSVVASTDAASVFAILRSRKLNLKGGLAPILEIESGSNDPVAYMMTIIFMSLLSGSGDVSIPVMLAKQLIFGLGIGALLGKITAFILRKVDFKIEGLYPIFVVAVGLLSYGLTEWVGGNGYLSVYLTGIIVGNSKIKHKKSLVHFLDGISWLMQIMIFFCLGLLSFPSKFGTVILPALAISAFLIFVARPIATFGILSWFKFPIKQQIFISWVGLRGAASIVFAIFAMTGDAVLQYDIFHIIFIVALISVSLQGTLLPTMAKKLDLVDDSTPVLKTFTDYEEEHNTQLLEYEVKENSSILNQTLLEADIPEGVLIVMIKRNNEIVIPNGSTVIMLGDILVLSGIDTDEFNL